MKIQNTEVQNGEPENDEVITVQPPTYEEAVPVELDLDPPVTTQPQSSLSTKQDYESSQINTGLQLEMYEDTERDQNPKIEKQTKQ